MSALFILISFSILVSAGFLAAFLWSAKTGQYDDDYTPSVRILFEDTPKLSKIPEEKLVIKEKRIIKLKRKQK